MKFLNFQQVDESTVYLIEVTAKIADKDKEYKFQIRERYSGMLEFTQKIVKDFEIALDIEFPEKKTFGNKDKVFL